MFIAVCVLMSMSMNMSRAIGILVFLCFVYVGSFIRGVTYVIIIVCLCVYVCFICLCVVFYALVGL